MVLLRKIKKIVEKLIEEYGTRDPYILCKYLNIDVSFIDLGSMKGFFRICCNRKMIMINENLSRIAKIIVLAHELGHAILHYEKDYILMKKSFINYTNQMEKEANIFAAELLLSDGFSLREEELFFLEIEEGYLEYLKSLID